VKGCFGGRQLIRSWRKLNDRLPNDVIQTDIAQGNPVGIDLILQARPALFSFDAAHFKNIGEIRIETNRKRNLNRRQAIVDQFQPLITDGLPNEFGAIQMHIATAQSDGAVDVNIGIGQIDGKKDVVFFDHRAQQERPDLT
jgi:hypothetical protein